MEVVMGTHELQEKWVHDRLERQSAYMLLRGLASQIEMLSTKSISSWKLPSNIVIRPLRSDEVRQRMQSGDFAVYCDATDELYVQLPHKYLSYEFHILNNLTDRGPINCAALHFLHGHDYLIACTCGIFHGIWNSVKNTLKQSCRGRPWQCTLGLLLLANLNHFPFKSKHTFRAKQDAWTQYVSIHSYESQSFQDIKVEFAEAVGMPCDCPAEEAELFSCLSKMASFNEMGPILKLARWCSINTVWKFLRPELPGMRLTLGTVLKNGGFGGLEHVASSTQASTDAEAIRAFQKPGGGLEKAHDWIAPANVWTMDMVDLITDPLRQLYSYRAKCVENIDQGVACNLQNAKTGLVDELQNIALKAFSGGRALRQLLHRDLALQERRCQEIFDFATTLMYYRVEQLVPEVHAYPGCSILSLDTDHRSRSLARTSMMEDLRILLKVEGLSHHHKALHKIINTIAWLTWPLIRLLLHMNEAENANPF